MWTCMAAQPGCVNILGHFAEGRSEQDDRSFGLRNIQTVAVEAEKLTGCQKGRALVAIDKSVVLGEPKGVTCCKRCKIWRIWMR